MPPGSWPGHPGDQRCHSLQRGRWEGHVTGKVLSVRHFVLWNIRGDVTWAVVCIPGAQNWTGDTGLEDGHSGAERSGGERNSEDF